MACIGVLVSVTSGHGFRVFTKRSSGCFSLFHHKHDQKDFCYDESLYHY